MRVDLRSAIILAALGALLWACGGDRPLAPISEQGTGIRYPESEYRVVVTGDTLYSIAWEAGRDYRDLAGWNGIRPPYILRPGQKIRLFPAAAKTAGAEQRYRVVVAGDTLYAIAEEIGVHYQDLARWNGIAPPYVIRPGQRLRLTPPATPDRLARRPSPSSKPSRQPNKRSSRSQTETDDARINAWTWPADGKLLARFTPSGTNKGLDIAGRRGEAIHAAAAGRVVYQGSGLRGYGQLIILKHNRDFLSAYAHCERAYVEEGEVIGRGQKIAAMGSSGTDRVKLHFEIRFRGSPVDPLKYLPGR